MKCPECIKEGKKSIVTQGMSVTIGMYQPTQWDEDGNRIPEKISKVIVNYSCSNGHIWNEEI